jgi:hypothetical protein
MTTYVVLALMLVMILGGRKLAPAKVAVKTKERSRKN